MKKFNYDKKSIRIEVAGNIETKMSSNAVVTMDFKKIKSKVLSLSSINILIQIICLTCCKIMIY